MATISVILRKDRLNGHGEAPINFLIVKDRKATKVSTGIKIPLKFWDDKKNKIKPSFPNSARLNSFLTNKFTELQDHVYEHETISKSLTTRNLKEKIYGKKPKDLFELAHEICEKYSVEGKIGTHDKARSILNKLHDFLNGSRLTFHEITPEFLEKYENHLRTVHNNKTNTIHKDMKFLRLLFNEAYRRNLIEHQQIPFHRYKLKQEKTQRIFLSEDELSKIETLVLKQNSREAMHRDMFVFAAYAGGLRVSDILELRWKNFDGLHLNFTIRKTKQQLSIKIPDKALKIISHYSSENADDNDFIFPVFSKDIYISDLRSVDAAISSATAHINKNLKSIARKAGIDKSISFHVSRHTWATRALRKGITIDKV
jgi:integrase/recombinase XerD